jgi:hypothetical protein
MNALANRVRAIPESLDERTTLVTIRTRTWVGGRRAAEGGYADVDLVLAPRPKVREVDQRDIDGSAGQYVTGDVRVGPITPSFPGGGYTKEQLAPTIVTNGVETSYLLSGGIDGDYARIDLTTDRSHSWFLVLRRKRTTP